jgi:DNA-binding transcriptional LysR family regulator
VFRSVLSESNQLFRKRRDRCPQAHRILQTNCACTAAFASACRVETFTLWELEKHGDKIAANVSGVLTLNHRVLTIDAAAGTLGMAYVPETVAQPWLSDGRPFLYRKTGRPRVRGLWAVLPGFHHAPLSLRAFINVVSEPS